MNHWYKPVSELTPEELEKRKALNKKIWKFGCFPIVILFFIMAVFSPKDSKESKQEEKVTYTAQDAFYQSREFVKKQLKAPASADFPFYEEGMASKIDDTTFFVKSYVDAQNSFGANLRSNYYCKIIYHSADNTVSCTDLSIISP